jgi:hypothetical protein
MAEQHERGYCTQLRQLLTDHFDAEELCTLCFDLGVDYDNLRGEGKTNKVRELVAYLERRGRIPELVATCHHQRPKVSWFGWPEAIPSTLPAVAYSRSLGQGLNALAELMQKPRVRNAVLAFRIDFEAAREQVAVIGNYKHLHDLLHTLQFHCYNPIVQEATRFPDDDMAVDNLWDYQLTLQRIVSDLRDAAERASLPATETSWIQNLVRAQEALSGAIEDLNMKLLKRAIWLLNRVLAVQPSRVNTRLNTAARTLRLPALVDAMACVSDNLASLDLDPEKVGHFEAGVDALVSLSHGLATLVDEHDRWQAIDLELRRVEANMGQDITELAISWPDLKAMTEPLCSGSADEWITSFRKDSDNLDRAIAYQNPTRIKRCFRRYRRQAGLRFHRVDVALKSLCDDLRKVGEPLASVMRLIE